MKKSILLVLSTILICACCVGGAYAWLFDKTQELTNTFTHGNVDITLSETTGESYKMIPGTALKKDPVVTVLKGSEACYLYVRITETNTTDVLSYELADGWTALEGQSGVWWRAPDDATVDTAFHVLKDDQVLVDTGVTGATPDAKLTVVAYAIQQSGISNAAAGWQELNSAGVVQNP